MHPREWNQLGQGELETLRRFQDDYPVKVGSVANSLGLKVFLKPLPAKISGEIRPTDETESGFLINVNRYEMRARQRFTIAHEIGHYLLHSHLIGGGIVDNVLYRSRLSNTIEAQANRFAADLLMPRHLILKVSQDLGISMTETYLDEFSEALGVSNQAMRIRLGL